VVRTPRGVVEYKGETKIERRSRNECADQDRFSVAGSVCGSLVPTRKMTDIVSGVPVTFIDNGMPVVAMAAASFGKTGYERVDELSKDTGLKARIETVRLEAGTRMVLGDVRHKVIPKMCFLAEARNGGAVTTRTFIPHDCHPSIGVFGAVPVATACVLSGKVAEAMAKAPAARNGAQRNLLAALGAVNVQIFEIGQLRPFLRSVQITTAYSSNSADVPGWTHTGDAGDALSRKAGPQCCGGTGTAKAGAGNQFVTLGGGFDSAGSEAWSQTVSGLTIGQSYVVSFLMAAEGETATQNTTLGITSGSLTPAETFTSLPTNTLFWQNWGPQQYTFVSTATAATLQFSVTNQQL